MNDSDYVLRSLDRDEVRRLELQHDVWKADVDRILEQAGFGAGHRIIDLGAGPGFLTFDLAEIVGPGGGVLAVDSSEAFVGHLQDEAATRGLEWVAAVQADVRAFDVEPEAWDGAVCRWVLMFLDGAEEALATAARALRPGGVIAVMEYVQFGSMSLYPTGEGFRRIYEAVGRLIARSGGDVDVGGRVPAMLGRTGFDIMDVIPTWRVGRPGSPLWRWLEATDRNHHILVEHGLVTESELQAYRDEWTACAADPYAFFTAPPLLATIARKR